jgi:hypothetical protein
LSFYTHLTTFPSIVSASLISTMTMTLSSPLKIIVACFAIAALVGTAMSGSESAGLKGSRKLQSFGGPASDAVNSIFSNSNNIISSLNPAIVAAPPPGVATVAVNAVNANAAFIFQAPPPGAATFTTNSVAANAAYIFQAPTPGAATFATNSVAANAAYIFQAPTPGAATFAANSVAANAALVFQGFNP